MALKRKIVGLGEALFDLFPDESRLGGAPLNVAVHAHQLGNEGVIVSRVGEDELGQRVREELRQRGMSDAYLQNDPDRPTGTVVVDFDEAGEPSFEIVRDVAWDALQYDHDAEDVAQHCEAMCFGSLAQRDGQARNTIYRYLQTARRAVRLFDVNLRQDYYDRRVLNRSLELATAAKLNTAELRMLDRMFNLGGGFDDAAEAMLQKFDLKWVALTRGAEGTAVYTPGKKHEAEPSPIPEGKGDPVGAGDATAAALLHGVTRRWPWERTLKLANALGAYVASRPGACPPIDDAMRELAGQPPAQKEESTPEASADQASAEEGSTGDQSAAEDST